MADTVPFSRRLLSEMLGTGLLVLLGTGCVMTNVITQGALGLTGIALTWGFLVTVLLATFGGISGAHIIPAAPIALTVPNDGRYLVAILASQRCQGQCPVFDYSTFIGVFP